MNTSDNFQQLHASGFIGYYHTAYDINTITSIASLTMRAANCFLYSIWMPKEEDTCRFRQLLLKALCSKNPAALYPCPFYHCSTTALPLLSTTVAKSLRCSPGSQLSPQMKPTGEPPWLLLLSVCSMPASLALGRQQASLAIVPTLLGQNLITAEYIPISGYCRPVKVLTVYDVAALSDSFLSQDLPG